jgi:membrane protease YdiL (CAAX protease family)
MPRNPAESRLSRISPHLRGHLLYFDGRPPTSLDWPAAARLLLVYVLLEGLIGPRLSIFRWLHLPAPAIWIRVPALIALALLLVRWLAGLNPARIGFRRWRDWSPTERSYFLQAVLIGNGVFVFLFAHGLGTIVSNRSGWGKACVVMGAQLAWGIYQELVYRGILQTAVVARWGPVAGILAANALFTFGPLHFYHFADASPAPMFAGIFAIGLFFSVLFWRSGNLWLVGVLHGIGNAYIDGLHALLR